MQAGERRQVSVLFCDIVGYTELATRIDQDDLLEIINTYYEISSQVIESFHGFVADYLGDGIMAYFGYPRSDEEAASNAIRAALELSSLLGKVDVAPGRLMQTRIAVATGVVIVRDYVIGLQSNKPTILGETPNLAARLQSVASPNTIVMSSSTKNITEGLFDYIYLGGQNLKGFSEPVDAYEVRGARSVGSRSQVRAETESDLLVGRDRELAVLRERWDEARRGHRRIVLLQGEAGIGKSRLVETLRSQLRAANEKCLNWFCGPNTSQTALYPVSEQLARAAGFTPGDDQLMRRIKLTVLMEKYGVYDLQAQEILADLMGLTSSDASSAEMLMPDKRKEIRLKALIAMLEAWAGNEPVMIVVEDLHWIDPTTLDLLNRIIEDQNLKRWLILTTARPEFRPQWEVSYTHLELERLDPRHAIRLCQHLCGENVLSNDEAKRIVDRCDGIPLFLEELTKSVMESLSQQKQEEVSTAIQIPETLHDSLVARLDRLGPARKVASIGAVIGRSFSKELLAAVTKDTGEELQYQLQALMSSGIVQSEIPEASADYTFKHALIRDAAYDSLLKRDREKLHQHIANVLKNQFPAICEAEPQLLAYHFAMGGSAAEAIPFWITAGQRMAANAAHAEAVSHFQQALELLRTMPSDEERSRVELDLLLGMAVSLSASKGYCVPEVGSTLEAARIIAESMGDINSLFAILRGNCNFKIVAGEMLEAERIAQRCMEISETTGLPEHRIEAHLPLGWVLFAMGRFPEAHHHLNQAVRLYGECDGIHLQFPTAQDPKIASLSALLLVLMALGYEQEETDAVKHLQAHIKLLNSNFDAVFGYIFLAWHAMDRERYQECLDFASKAAELCEQNGYSYHGYGAKVYQAVARAHLDICSPSEAVSQAEAGIKSLIQLEANHALPHRMSALSGLYAMAGDLDRAFSLSQQALKLAHQKHDDFSVPMILLRQWEIKHDSRSPQQGPMQDDLIRRSLQAAEQMGARGLREMILNKASVSLNRPQPEEP